jgi:hypothetical protein
MYRPHFFGILFFLTCLCCLCSAEDAPILHAPASVVGLVDAPQPSFLSGQTRSSTFLPDRPSPAEEEFLTPGGAAHPYPDAVEPFHWKGLIFESLGFEMLQNVTRVITADQNDRHILLNKPFWSDYWASLQQFNMRRWNDGDSIKVNYIGHPMQGAIAGYLQIQNDPRGRNLRISHDPAYWKSRYHAFLWELVYSTQWEIGPLGETAIFNQGGFTYPIRCNKHRGTPDYCEQPTTVYTNNTGWVDFIITPVVGSLWLLGEDTIDRYISDPLIRRHPDGFGYKLIRASLNPPRSLADMLRGRFPWYRDYEDPGSNGSAIHRQFVKFLYDEPVEHLDLNLHYSSLGLQTDHTTCMDCRMNASGAGVELGIRLRRYIDFTSDVSNYPQASPVSSLNKGGTLTTATFGVRSGYVSRHYAVRVGLAPGLASYSKTGTDPDNLKRNFNFAASATLEGDLRISDHFGFRATAVQMLIRYKSLDRDPDGIGTPPRLSFLSHDNYINSTNWGVQLGPVLRF